MSVNLDWDTLGLSISDCAGRPGEGRAPPRARCEGRGAGQRGRSPRGGRRPRERAAACRSRGPAVARPLDFGLRSGPRQGRRRRAKLSVSAWISRVGRIEPRLHRRRGPGVDRGSGSRPAAAEFSARHDEAGQDQPFGETRPRRFARLARGGGGQLPRLALPPSGPVPQGPKGRRGSVSAALVEDAPHRSRTIGHVAGRVG